jgi:hypothetical protein
VRIRALSVTTCDDSLLKSIADLRADSVTIVAACPRVHTCERFGLVRPPDKFRKRQVSPFRPVGVHNRRFGVGGNSGAPPSSAQSALTR